MTDLDLAIRALPSTDGIHFPTLTSQLHHETYEGRLEDLLNRVAVAEGLRVTGYVQWVPRETVETSCYQFEVTWTGRLTPTSSAFDVRRKEEFYPTRPVADEVARLRRSMSMLREAFDALGSK